MIEWLEIGTKSCRAGTDLKGLRKSCSADSAPGRVKESITKGIVEQNVDVLTREVFQEHVEVVSLAPEACMQRQTDQRNRRCASSSLILDRRDGGGVGPSSSDLERDR